MIQSMTGYGKAETILETGKITVEIKSLNGKNADISIKTSLLPKEKELVVRQMIAKHLTRGNIDFFINYEPNNAESGKTINAGTVLEYYRQLADIRNRINDKAFMTQETSILLGQILRLPDVIDTKKQDIITDDNWSQVEECIARALENINTFRSREGISLYNDVTSKVHSILSYVDEVEKHEKERIELIREKIISRFNELKLEMDSSRLEQEMIFYIEKLDINEEKVRLRQHCRYFLETIDTEPCPGKKLGFIAQEMGREINTTGSKANNSDIQKIVVKMKDDLEKIKEQSLNIL